MSIRGLAQTTDIDLRLQGGHTNFSVMLLKSALIALYLNYEKLISIYINARYLFQPPHSTFCIEYAINGTRVYSTKVVKHISSRSNSFEVLCQTEWSGSPLPHKQNLLNLESFNVYSHVAVGSSLS